jgi:hypothetical protein
VSQNTNFGAYSYRPIIGRQRLAVNFYARESKGISMNRVLQFAAALGCLFAASVSRAQPQTDSGKVCPLWPIYSLGDIDLFYCDRYQKDDCTDEPTVEYDYLPASTPCPCPCANCVQRAPTAHSGVVTAIGPNDPYPRLDQLPVEAQRRMKVLTDPDLTFVDCRDADGNSYIAKVFLLLVATQSKNKDYQHPPRFVYVAFQTTDPGNVSGRHDIGKVERLKPDDDHYNVFSGKWTPAAADYQILFVAKN